MTNTDTVTAIATIINDAAIIVIICFLKKFNHFRINKNNYLFINIVINLKWYTV